MDILSLTNLIISNSVLALLGLRLVRRFDQLDQRIDTHETRISIAEREIEYAEELNELS